MQRINSYIAMTKDEAAQGQRSWDRPWSFPEPAALYALWAIQGSDNGRRENRMHGLMKEN
jgi:hypothetical protein